MGSFIPVSELVSSLVILTLRVAVGLRTLSCLAFGSHPCLRRLGSGTGQPFSLGFTRPDSFHQADTTTEAVAFSLRSGGGESHSTTEVEHLTAVISPGTFERLSSCQRSTLLASPAYRLIRSSLFKSVPECQFSTDSNTDNSWRGHLTRFSGSAMVRYDED